jgi:hypothetical protein
VKINNHNISNEAIFTVIAIICFVCIPFLIFWFVPMHYVCFFILIFLGVSDILIFSYGMAYREKDYFIAKFIIIISIILFFLILMYIWIAENWDVGVT